MYSFLLHIATLGCIYSLFALGLNLQAGVGGLLNFGFIAFVGAGAYGSAITLGMGGSVLMGIAVGILVAAVIGFVMAGLGRSLSADYWAIATLAVTELLRTFALNESWLTGGARGIGGIKSFVPVIPGLSRDAVFFFFVLVILIIAWFLTERLVKGRFGRAVRLMREEPDLVSSFGYRLVPMKIKITIFGGAIAAIGGSLLVHYLSYVGPDYMLANETFLIWTMVMIGGLGNNLGVVFGGFLVQAIYSMVPFVKDYLDIGTDTIGAIRLGVIGFLLLFCLMYRPGGLIPEKIRSPR